MTRRPNEEKIEKRLEQKQEERSKEDSCNCFSGVVIAVLCLLQTPSLHFEKACYADTRFPLLGLGGALSRVTSLHARLALALSLFRSTSHSLPTADLGSSCDGSREYSLQIACSNSVLMYDEMRRRAAMRE